MRLSLITAPVNEPLMLEEVKEHLRVTVDDDDSYIHALIHAAIDHLDGRDGRLGRALITQTWQLELDEFPWSWPRIILPLPPLQSIVSVTYVDAGGVWAGSPPSLPYSTMAAGDYIIDTTSRFGQIVLRSDKSWPGTRAEYGAVRVKFVAGYGDDGEDIPMPIRQAMYLLIGHWYEHREEVVVGQPVAPLPMAVDALLGPYEVVTFA